jgi:hypothetical protein
MEAHCISKNAVVEKHIRQSACSFLRRQFVLLANKTVDKPHSSARATQEAPLGEELCLLMARESHHDKPHCFTGATQAAPLGEEVPPDGITPYGMVMKLKVCLFVSAGLC